MSLQSPYETETSARSSCRSFSYGQVRTGLFTLSLRGNPTLQEVELLHRAMATASRYDLLIDASLLGCLDPAVFEHMSAWLTRHKGLVARLALVRPSGLTGAVVTGLYQLLEPTGPFQTFTDASAAAHWLDLTHAQALLRAITDEHAHAQSWLRELRVSLRACSGSLGLPETARKLGMSVRTLQRKLESAATSFRVEQLSAKLERAQTLMLTSDASLTRIAIDLEFASPQHFSTLFRKHCGCTPSQWREQRRLTA